MLPDAAIREFWSWWETARHQVLRSIEVDRAFADGLVTEICKRVEAIGDLDWELSPGKTAKHAFCLSPRGNSEKRLVTEYWRHLGPAPDATWEYFAARQPNRNTRITYDGVDLDRGELVVAFEVKRDRERIDGAYFHPAFARLDAEARGGALFLLLDGALGEDGVERWLGAIEHVDAAPPGGRPFAELEAAVDELARTATGFSGAVLRAETDDGPVFFAVNLALKRIDHLLHTQRIAVELPIRDRNEHGLPTSADAERLGALEDQLEQAIGGRATWFGRETRAGRRTIYWYAPEDSGARGIVEQWAAANGATCTAVRDPTWELARQF